MKAVGCTGNVSSILKIFFFPYFFVLRLALHFHEQTCQPREIQIEKILEKKVKNRGEMRHKD